MTLFCYRVIIDTRDTAVTKADWIPISNGSESSALLICVYKCRSHCFGMGFTEPITCSLPGSIWSYANTTSITWPFRIITIVPVSREGESTGPKARKGSHSTPVLACRVCWRKECMQAKLARTQVLLRRIRLSRVQSCCLVTQVTGYLHNWKGPGGHREISFG